MVNNTPNVQILDVKEKPSTWEGEQLWIFKTSILLIILLICLVNLKHPCIRQLQLFYCFH
jgi:hypothetical protein